MKYLDKLINEITIKQKLEKERKKINTNPSEKQKESGNYTKGHININGFEITIENPKGSYRKGVDSNGKEWKIKMNNDYGYFLKSIGYDGDHIDVFLGNDFDSKKIFVVDQKINGKFDESKVMLGFKTSNEAKKAYLSNYEKNWKGFHKITEVDEETFKTWLYDGKKQRKAFSEYKDMKLNETVNKIVKNILIESQESKSQSEAIKLLQQKLEWDYEKANNFVRNDLRNDITSLRDKKIAKFTLGVTRMFVDRQLNNASVIGGLNATLKLLSAHLDEYDRNLNNISAQELISKFERTRRDNLESERNEIDSMKFSESNYQIVPINSFEEAKKYYGYTNPNSRWCLTHMEDMFESYTNDGINQLYFCLRNGFENVKPIIGENAPLDEYGLSMLSIIVNENGELAYCTTRWNHDNGGSDSAMNAKQISEVVGVNFYQTFKPNNKWNELLASVEQRLANGENYKDVFDYCDNFYNGFARVRLNKKYNFINQEGRFLSNQWFDRCGNFFDSIAAVKLNKKWNFINQEGELLSSQWFDDFRCFNNGFTMVKLNTKYNFINQEGELISNQWFDNYGDFNEGFAAVNLNNKYNFINQEGELLSNQWFDDCYAFNNGFARVKLNKKWNFINQEGELLSNQWFETCDKFYEGLASVKLNGKWYFLTQEGNLYNEDFNLVNINENISRKFKSLKINESKIRRIVNESIKKVLLEGKEQTRLTNILIKKLYKVAQNYKRLYKDNDWTYLRALMNDLSNVPGVRDFNYGGGKYHQNGKEFGESAYKLYTVEIETEFDTIIRGEVYCNFAGTIDDPWSRYDMTVNFWRDSENINTI